MAAADVAQGAELGAPSKQPAGDRAQGGETQPSLGQRRSGERRTPPDYDGRPEPVTLGEAALWVPRVVFFPLYLASEYLVRRPLGWLVSTAEREHWPTLIIDFFTFGPGRQVGIIPTGLIDFGMRPSVGLYVFWNDFLVEGNDLRFRAAYGGEDFHQLRLSDRFAVGEGTLALTVGYESRPDTVFRGIGRDPAPSRSRYLRRLTRGGGTYTLDLAESGYARFALGVRQTELDGGRTCCDDPSVDQRVAAGDFPLPPGMGQVFEVADQGIELVWDSRPLRWPELEPASDHVVPPGHGVRFALRGSLSEVLGQSLALAEPLADAWVHYGASLGGFVDLTGQQRSLGLTAIVDFVDPFGGGSVPLTDLVSAGGDRPLRGFVANEFSDRSLAALRLEYRWPVAVWLDGSLQYEVGNVFGAGLSGFDLAALRSSFGLGMVTVGTLDNPFQALVAVGTESFEDGSDIDSVRIVFGTTAGF